MQKTFPATEKENVQPAPTIQKTTFQTPDHKKEPRSNTTQFTTTLDNNSLKTSSSNTKSEE